MSFKIEYSAYYKAKRRCTDPKNNEYHNYGARGIQFRFNSFTEFIEHIGPKPTGYFLDRIDNDGHYEIGNVRWVSLAVSQLHKRKQKNNTSGYRGVSRSKGRRVAFIKHDGRNENLGYFGTPKEAAIKWNEYAKKYRGEHAELNPI